jgi:hypothetical protein
VAFAVPAGWIGSLAVDSGEVELASPAHRGKIILSAGPMDLSSASMTMQRGLTLRSGITVLPASPVQRWTNTLGADFVVRGFDDVVARVFANFGKFGIGVYVVAFADEAALASTWSTAERVLRSLQFARPKQVAVPAVQGASNAVAPSPAEPRRKAAPTDPGPIGPTDVKVVGARLRHNSSSYGTFHETVVTLSCDGSFSWHSSTSNSSQNGSVNLNDSEGGRYQQVGNELKLFWDDGATSDFRLAPAGGDVKLDGKLYLRKVFDCT